MLKVGGLRLVISMLIVFGISINLFAARPLNDFKPYYEDLKNYIPFENCNLVHNKIYEVCWNLENGMPDSGWAIIDSLKNVYLFFPFCFELYRAISALLINELTLSPVKWPKLSFMNLKLSKSRKINAHLEFLFCLRYFSTCVKNTDLLHEKA